MEFQSRFDAVASGIVVHSAQGEIVYANRAACDILCLTREQLQGRTSTDPRWRAVHEDGSPFPGDEHPAMVTLRTGKPVRDVIMGIYDSQPDHFRWIVVNSEPILDAATGRVEEVVATFIDITRRRAMEQAMNALNARVESMRGGTLLSSLVQQLAEIVGADFAYIGEVNGSNGAHVTTVVACAHGKIVENFEYELAGTPTEAVIENKGGYFWDRVQSRFADDRLLAELGVESFIGVPLFLSADRTLRLIVVMNRRPFIDPWLAESMLQIYAILASAEMERRSAEATLVRTEALYRQAITETGGVPYQRDYASPGYTFMGEGVEALTGFRAQELTGKFFGTRLRRIDFFGPGRELPHEERVRLTREGILKKWRADYLFEKKDGSLVWLSDAAVPLFDPAGKPVASLGILTDITDRKRAEEALAEEKERLTVTLRSISDAVITTDIHGRIVLMNRVAEELSGWRQEEARGRALEKVLSLREESSRRRCRSPAKTVLEAGGVVEISEDFLLLCRDGSERIAAISGAPICDRESEVIGVVLVCRDITEKRRIEEELQKVKTLESLGLLAGGVAHDFNNILTAITGLLSLARISLSSKKELLTILDEAENASLRARSLTQQLLAFAKGGAPIKKMASISDLLRESVTFALRGSKVRCRFQIDSGVCNVDMDIGQIHQVINNLVINAVQAMPDGGTIDVRCETVDLAPYSTPLPEGRYVRVSVRDSGCGIAKEHLSKIFDPYFTTKSGGSGLGLAISYRILKNHGGHLEVESELGVGSTFILHLPASDRTMDAGDEIAREVLTGEGKILVLDDEEIVRHVAGRILRRLGFEVQYAEEGGQAVELYEKALKAGDPYKVVIMDLTIPGGMGGKEAIKRLREIDPKVKAIVSSGYSNDPVMAMFRDYGFDGVVSKPYSVSELSSVVHRVMQQM